jgi:hypothetical protein
VRALRDPEYRFERKFRVSGLSIDEVVGVVEDNPAFFHSVHQPRIVNNIYFDTVDLLCREMNIEGVASRQKFRVRWYGDAINPKSPILELKVKRGLAGWKHTFPVESFTIGNREEILSGLMRLKLPVGLVSDLQFMEPTLFNSYRRKYFMTAEGNIRLTIDDLQQTKRILARNFQLNNLTKHYDIIVELKYSEEYDKQAAEIANHFPFRMTKNSKYVVGMTE